MKRVTMIVAIALLVVLSARFETLPVGAAIVLTTEYKANLPGK